MSVQVSLCGMLTLIRIDTLRRVRNVSFSRGTAHMWKYSARGTHPTRGNRKLLHELTIILLFSEFIGNMLIYNIYKFQICKCTHFQFMLFVHEYLDSHS